MTGSFKICCWPQGLSSKDFVTELGYLGCEEIIHRDNICLLQRPHSNPSEALVASGGQQGGSALINGLWSDDERGHSSPDNGTPPSHTWHVISYARCIVSQ